MRVLRPYEFVVHDGDIYYGDRTKLGQALPSRAYFTAPGDCSTTQTIAGSPSNVYLPNDFFDHRHDWNGIGQWKRLLARQGPTGAADVWGYWVHQRF
jgi:hypothetical protein